MWRRVNWLGITFFITLWWWWCSPSPDVDQSARSTPQGKTISKLHHYFKELRHLDMRVCKWRARHRQVKAPGSMAGVPRSRHFRTQRYGKQLSLRHTTTWDTDSSHWMRQYELHLPGPKHRPVTGLCKYTKEPSVHTKCEESLDWLTFTAAFSRAALFHGAWYGTNKTGNERINVRVILKRGGVTIVTAERACVCNISYPACNAHEPCYVAICDLSDSAISFPIT
jgi:hypothetical protein